MKLFKIVYAWKYREMGIKYHLRHCVIISRATRYNRNVLVQLQAGERAIVPIGNLVKAGYLK